MDWGTRHVRPRPRHVSSPLCPGARRCLPGDLLRRCWQPGELSVQDLLQVIIRMVMMMMMISCREGFTLEGSDTAVCEPSMQWRYPSSSPPSCHVIRYPPPFIICPPDIVKPLPPGSSTVYVMFSQPKTNVDWHRCEI